MFRPAARRSTLVVGVIAFGLAAGCSSDPTAQEEAAASSSVASASAALSSAAQASPGEYGSPVDPDLPNPTDVATDPTATTGGDAVSVVITYAGWITDSGAVEVGAIIPGIIEDGGECVLVLSGPGDDATVAVQAEADADSTTCPTMSVPGQDLSSGSWDAMVRYSSPSRTGTSAETTVDVP